MTVSWEFIDELAATLPKCEDTSKPDQRRWCAKGRAFAWERPLSKKDMAALGDAAPRGRVLAIRTQDLGVRDAWMAAFPRVCFTSEHFLNYPAILVDLELADEQVVREVFSETALWIVDGAKH